MSIPTNFHGLRVSVERGEKIGNKTHFSSSGDNNANQVTSVTDQEEGGLIEVTGYNTGSIPPLVRQSESPDKVVIWDSEQQCVEPKLREFEIHTFVGNQSQEENNDEEDDGESMRDGKDEGPMSISSSSTTSSASTGSAEKRDTRTGRDRRMGVLKESKSETNVFVSSLSAVALAGSLSSALDCSGEASLISLPSRQTNPFPNTNSTTSAQSSRRATSSDTNQNSPLFHPQERYDYPQYCSQEQRLEERSHHGNGMSSDGGFGQRRRAGFEERVLPPRRQQLVRPLCQTEMMRERNLPEPKAQQTGTVPPSSINVSPESHSSRSNKKFTKSALREPSDFSHLYNMSGVYQLRQPNQASQREVPSMEKHPTTTAQNASGPSNPPMLDKKPQAQLSYRRNCSSPNRSGVESRSSTPPHSPLRTPQGSPRRQPSMYLISRNVSGASRHIPSGCNPSLPTSTQGYSNSCLRAPVKTNISTSGIPKAPPNIQHSSSNSNPKENSTSPKLKPKGIRPKIITSVRKNPQFKLQAADGPYQVSSLPSRLSTYAHSQSPAAFKDPSKDPCKPEVETRGAPVLSASNPLYDKYRQEMQVNSFPPGMQNRSTRAPGHTNTVPPAHIHSHNASPKLSSRAENYCGTLSEVS
ncbi:hypothetical protein GOODEAATRI_010665 [Goodea atripinnis]|uniref:Uncharacterized protein n=1 Tax=Goodea atripinnis TaxID=208336 RepID=A0ABV0PCZ3_9TELE